MEKGEGEQGEGRWREREVGGRKEGHEEGHGIKAMKKNASSLPISDGFLIVPSTDPMPAHSQRDCKHGSQSPKSSERSRTSQPNHKTRRKDTPSTAHTRAATANNQQDPRQDNNAPCMQTPPHPARESKPKTIKVHKTQPIKPQAPVLSLR